MGLVLYYLYPLFACLILLAIVFGVFKLNIATRERRALMSADERLKEDEEERMEMQIW